MNQEITICNYSSEYRTQLYGLLIKLQVNHFAAVASPQYKELRKEVSTEQAYSSYIRFMEQHAENWKILLAVVNSKVAGMIIGSIEKDDDLILGTIGKLEDWYVEEDYRKQGVGAKLYAELEKWFVQNGCQQVLSDTWKDNESSIKAHEQLGFYITGVQFAKKL